MSCRRLLAVALWLLAMLAAPVASAAPAGPAIGDAPPVALLGKDRAGQVVDLGQLRGKVVVVTFWASWCGYCLKELPQLDLLQKHAGDRLLRVVAVNVKDGNDDYRAMMRQPSSTHSWRPSTPQLRPYTQLVLLSWRRISAWPRRSM